jgi:hypothetical protein
MSRLPHLREALAASTLCTLALLSACTSSSDTGATPSSAAASTTGTASPSNAGSTPAADAVTINISIKNGQVSPSGEKINVRQGQTVIEHVTSDMDDEVHAHNGGDGYELEVKAGVPTTGQFVATDVGSFEVESHHLNKVIAILVVR